MFPREIIELIAHKYISPDTYNTASIVSKEWRKKAIDAFKTPELIKSLTGRFVPFTLQVGKFIFEKKYDNIGVLVGGIDLFVGYGPSVFSVYIFHERQSEHITWKWNQHDGTYRITEFVYCSRLSACEFLCSVFRGLTMLLGEYFDPFTEDNPSYYCSCDKCIHITSYRWIDSKSIAPHVLSMELRGDCIGAEIMHKQIHGGVATWGLSNHDENKWIESVNGIGYEFRGNYRWMISNYRHFGDVGTRCNNNSYL